MTPVSARRVDKVVVLVFPKAVVAQVTESLRVQQIGERKSLNDVSRIRLKLDHFIADRPSWSKRRRWIKFIFRITLKLAKLGGQSEKIAVGSSTKS